MKSKLSRKTLAASIILLILTSILASAALGQTPLSIIFLHHSCGENLIHEGGVREGLSALGYEFYDHGYNDQGLCLADGACPGSTYSVPGDNTDPDGIATVFAQPLNNPPDNTFSQLMQYDVIAFKSCYPTSNIGSDEQLNEFKNYYLSVRARADQYPQKLFIVVTQPPQVPGESNAQEATRARALAEWLKSDEFLGGHPNIVTFDFFDLLAADDNLLRREYRYNNRDGHPNTQANQAIGPQFVAFIDQAIQNRDLGSPMTEPTVEVKPVVEVEPTVEVDPVTEPVEVEPVEVEPVEVGLVEAETWHSSSETGSSITCAPEPGNTHSGDQALHIQHNIINEGWADCGTTFEQPQNFGDSAGLAFWVHSEGAREWAALMLFSGDPDSPTPFEIDLDLDASSWTQKHIAWDELERAEWADADGLTQIDPTRIIGYGFSLGEGNGDVWIDDMTLFSSEDTAEPAEHMDADEDDLDDHDDDGAEAPAPQNDSETEDNDESQGSGGTGCPGVVLPLGAVAFVLAKKRTWHGPAANDR